MLSISKSNEAPAFEVMGYCCDTDAERLLAAGAGAVHQFGQFDPATWELRVTVRHGGDLAALTPKSSTRLVTVGPPWSRSSQEPAAFEHKLWLCDHDDMLTFRVDEVEEALNEVWPKSTVGIYTDVDTGVLRWMAEDADGSWGDLTRDELRQMLLWPKLALAAPWVVEDLQWMFEGPVALRKLTVTVLDLALDPPAFFRSYLSGSVDNAARTVRFVRRIRGAG